MEGVLGAYFQLQPGALVSICSSKTLYVKMSLINFNVSVDIHEETS